MHMNSFVAGQFSNKYKFTIKPTDKFKNTSV